MIDVVGVFFAIQYLQRPSKPLTNGQSDVRSLHRGFKTKALARLLATRRQWESVERYQT